VGSCGLFITKNLTGRTHFTTRLQSVRLVSRGYCYCYYLHVPAVAFSTLTLLIMCQKWHWASKKSRFINPKGFHRERFSYVRDPAEPLVTDHREIDRLSNQTCSHAETAVSMAVFARP